MTIADDLNKAIYGGSPYEGLDIGSYPLDLQGWCDEPQIFDSVIAEAKPELIIEVGSWKGTSSHYMLNKAPNACMVCVDTWLGSSEHWVRPEFREMLGFKNGRPTLYEQFMANVVHAGLQHRVVPLPLPSRLASIVLQKFGVQSSMIYIDGAHDEASVSEDIEAYWPLVSPGGIMLGDDHVEAWSGVMRAVARFRSKHRQEIEQTQDIRTRWRATKVTKPKGFWSGVTGR